MKTLMTVLTVLTIFVSLSLATVMGDLAASMGTNSWAELQTTNIQSVLTSSGASNSITSYANSAAWDPVSKQLFFVGGDHNDVPRFVSYSDATNTWQHLPKPGWLGGDTQWHAYDYNAVDPVSSNFYLGYNKYNISNQSWSSIPSVPGYDWRRGYPAVGYFPELGGLVITGSSWSYSGTVFFYNDNSGQWSTLTTGLSFGGLHSFSTYNPVHKVLLFGGGDEGHRKLFKMNYPAASYGVSKVEERKLLLTMKLYIYVLMHKQYILQKAEASFGELTPSD